MILAGRRNTSAVGISLPRFACFIRNALFRGVKICYNQSNKSAKKRGNAMNYLWGALAGLVWGALWGGLNILILKRSLGKNDSNILMAGNLARMVVDLAALLLVFLLRKILPFSYEAMLVATAVALSVTSLIFAFRYGKK